MSMRLDLVVGMLGQRDVAAAHGPDASAASVA